MYIVFIYTLIYITQAISAISLQFKYKILIER